MSIWTRLFGKRKNVVHRPGTTTSGTEDRKQPGVQTSSHADGSSSEAMQRKIWQQIGPSSLTTPDDKFWDGLSDEAVPVIKEIFRHPSDNLGTVNEALLVVGLRHFAGIGNTDAVSFLCSIAEGNVPLAGAYAQQAMILAKDFAEKRAFDQSGQPEGLDAILTKVRKEWATLDDYARLVEMGQSVIPAIKQEIETGGLYGKGAEGCVLVLESFGQAALPAIVDLLGKKLKPPMAVDALACALHQMGSKATEALSHALLRPTCSDLLNQRALDVWEYMVTVGGEIRLSQPALKALATDATHGSRAHALLGSIQSASNQPASSEPSQGNLFRPTSQIITSRRAALVAAMDSGAKGEWYHGIHLDYFYLLFGGGVELPTDVLVDVLLAASRYEGTSWPKMWNSIIAELARHQVREDRHAAEALAGVMKRLSDLDGTSDECYATSLTLLLQNADGVVLGGHLAEIYERQCWLSNRRTEPLLHEMLSRREDCIPPLKSLISETVIHRDSLEELLSKLESTQ